MHLNHSFSEGTHGHPNCSSYCLYDDLLKAMNHFEDPQCQMSDAEVMTKALVAVMFFGGNHEGAHGFLQDTGYTPRMLTKSRFNRRWHRLAEHW
jgi:hypothetical protein